MFGDSRNSLPTRGRTLTATLTEHAAYKLIEEYITADLVSLKNPLGFVLVSSYSYVISSSPGFEGYLNSISINF